MADSANSQGCLTAILKIIGIDLTKIQDKTESLPYRIRDDFLSNAELSFYGVIKQVVREEYVVCPKVNLGDLFYVTRSKDKLSYQNKINRKHVDFLLCDPATLNPRLGIELDDSSHLRKDRQERDQFVESVFEAAGLALLRIPVAKAYSTSELVSLIQQKVTNHSTRKVEVDSQSDKPICPECEEPMVLRISKKGRQKGKKFWGCSNYPKCKAVTEI